MEALLSPLMLEDAGAYWSQDLLGQVPEGSLPAWDAVVGELQPLLADFLPR